MTAVDAAIHVHLANPHYVCNINHPPPIDHLPSIQPHPIHPIPSHSLPTSSLSLLHPRTQPKQQGKSHMGQIFDFKFQFPEAVQSPPPDALFTVAG
jgi:hypothetical protein